MEYFTNLPQLGSWLQPEDVYAGVYAGAVESLAAGVTSILDDCHCIQSPEHADAAVEALRAAGIRATFGYDLRGRDPAGTARLGPSSARFADAERVRHGFDNRPEDLIRMAICLNGDGHEAMEQIAREIAFARDLGCSMSYHNSTGGEIVLLHQAGLLLDDILPAHGNYALDEDFDLLGAVGGYLSTQPEAETYAGRRSMTMVRRAHRRGVGIALGVDVPALVSLGIMPQMRLLHFLQRYLDGMQERLEGQVPVARRPGVPTLTLRDIFRFGTTNGHAALGLASAVGEVAPGFQADLVLLDARTFGRAEGDPAAHVILNSSHGDVHSVLVAGEFRKRDGRLVGVDTERMVSERETARRRVFEAAGARPQFDRTVWGWAEAAQIPAPAR
jgi:cytosine/adenosine deaminase-related metal-dependent hydrolase